MTHNFGWKPSYPDPRNIVADASLLPIAPEVDPRSSMSTPYDQGQLGSCTANAIAGAHEYNTHLDGHGYMPSRLFIYWEERKIEGTIDYDSGAYGRDGFQVLKTLGAPPESDWPYNISQFKTAPSSQVLSLAGSHKIGVYKHPSQSLITLKRILSNRQTIAFGFSVFESFESQKVASTGVVPLPGPTEAFLGGHEVLLIGYLASQPNYGLCRNSWGTNWGVKGYFLMPWAYILDPSLCTDFRTIYRPWNG